MNGRKLKDLEANTSLLFKDRLLEDEIRHKFNKFANPRAGFGFLSDFKRNLRTNSEI